MLCRFAISPLDVIKIRLQVQSEPYNLKHIFAHRANVKYSGINQAFKTIIKEEGIKGLFKGNVAAEWLYVTYGASQLYAYYHLDSFLKNISPTVKPFISGMFAGSFATAATYPFDLLRTRFAMQGMNKVYDSIPHAISDIYEKEGMRGFYRGLGSSITQIMPYMGLMFFSYEGLCSTVQHLQRNQIISENHKRTNDMICGSLAGIISKTGVFPLDVIRKRLQVQGPHLSEYVVSTIPTYSSSVWECMKKIINTEGVLGLYKGIVPGLLKAGPSGAVYFLMFEIAKDCITYLKDSGFQILPEKPVLRL
ncbi:mitochondrial carrier domain-containing protein [Cokeromyces recurvatus]|uniref:mitochondrial carrier domain-containing protein n=1 Tax=Cokeromyces recurvatus TaxID=90255 RepID=UPI00221FE00E|nr:mitochondrial carrier domain-containing protein [Cokeromyces recurvatus]KAI7903710.1 mitochondrial carrier domain-containing protein [Cokeromyces recurvatus]